MIETNLKNKLTSCYEDLSNIINENNIKDKNVKLQIVSKQQPIEKIRILLNEGHSLFGENKLQEAQEKWIDLKNDFKNIKLHFIGKLQSNKTKEVVQLFDAVESLDRYKVAEKLDYFEKKIGKKLDYFIQVNTGKEKQKAGVYIEDCGEFIHNCRKYLNLNIVGLMCIPPQGDEPSLHFSLIKNLAKSLNLTELSMGMSNDYKIAIECGSTQIRLGRRIFGPRQVL